MFSRNRAVAEGAGGGRDAAGAVGETGGRFSDARIRAAGAAVQFESGGALEQLGPLSRVGPRGIDDVRANDGGKLDLHRHAGNFAGDVRNVCGSGEKTFRREFSGKAGGNRRDGRHGRSAAPSWNDEWRSVSGDRRGPGAHQAAREGRLLRRDGDFAGRGAADSEKRGAQGRGDFGWIGGKLRGLDPGTGEARRGAGLVDGPDERARSHRRVRAEWNDAGSGSGAAKEES